MFSISCVLSLVLLHKGLEVHRGVVVTHTCTDAHLSLSLSLFLSPSPSLVSPSLSKKTLHKDSNDAHTRDMSHIWDIGHIRDMHDTHTYTHTCARTHTGAGLASPENAGGADKGGPEVQRFT